MRNIIAVVVVGLVLMTCFARPADAYLDPTSGSMLLQLVIAGVAGAAVVIKLYWQKLWVRLRRESGEASENGET